MKEAKANPKRIAMYVIYDKDGILDNFRKYYLKELRKVCDTIVGVVSGTLTPESREELEELTDDFFVRENRGLLAGSWIDGIAHIGWDKLAEYDELLMLNDSFFGPFYPLSEMMDAAEKSDADFYGCMKNFEDESIHEMHGHAFKHGHLRGSIPYFLIIKSRLLHSNEFIKYWSSVPKVENDWDTYFFAEFDFYDYVIDAGFKVDAYESDRLEGYDFDLITRAAYKLIKEDRIPFARIRQFGTDLRRHSLAVDYGKDVRETMKYLCECTDYNTDYIWEYLLRTKNLSDIYYQHQLSYVIPSACLEYPYTYNKKLAVILHIYYEDLVEKMVGYCCNFPHNTDFYVTTTREKVKEKIEAEFAKYALDVHCEVRPNVGVAISTLWITYSDVVLKGEYEYICYFHDKKSPYWGKNKEGLEFGERCYNNLVGTSTVIKNIVNRFEKEPRLGMIGPPAIYHGHYFNVAMNTWPVNYKNTVELAKKLDIHVAIDPNIEPVAPYGDMFWFRSNALKKVIGAGLTYDDFDFKYKPDGTILHAIERIYGYAVQDSGYYYATVTNTDDAQSDIANYEYLLKTVCRILNQDGCHTYTVEAMLYTLELLSQGCGWPKRAFRLRIKDRLKRICPTFIWNFLKKIYLGLGGKKWVG